jgi:long-chain acyl-CoA synthetase
MSTVPQYRNLCDLLQRSVKKYAANPFLGTRQSDGSWEFITYREFGVMVDRFRAGLASLGVEPGDRVAIIADNRVEWAVTAHATYSLGALICPMYQKQNKKDWEYIIRDSGAKVLVVANTDIAKRTLPFVDEIDFLKHVIDMEGPASDEGSYAGLLVKGAASPVPAADPEPDDVCGFIYTSGTTGNPKGVLLTHRNITSNAEGAQTIFPLEESDRTLSFLPWAHSFGQTVELHCGTGYGISLALCDDTTRLVEYLGEVKPTLLFAVPRIFNKIYDGLHKKMAAESAFKQRMFKSAVSAAQRKRALDLEGKRSGFLNFKLKILDKLVFSKVRARLGGRLRYAFSGGAAISREVAEFIDDTGILVYEGYGLSETSPMATANCPGHRKIGSTGKALPHVEVIIDTGAVSGTMGDQGEILVKGPNVMKGYHNLPDKTAEVMREDGAFRTGDLGRLDSEGFLFITGRIKEQYKLENGKYVVPSPLEEQLQLSGFISQVLVFGDNKSHNVALIVPDEVALKKFAAEKGISGELADLFKNDQVRALYKAELDHYGQEVFKGFERVRAFDFIAEEFSTENDMLTPTMKLKRRNVIKAYQHLLDALFKA